MNDFFKTNFQFLIVVGMVLLLFFQRTTEKNPQPAPIIIFASDTTTKEHNGGVTTQPIIYQTIPYPVEKITKEYQPDTNYAKLKLQYEELRSKFLATTIQKDSLNLDSLGGVGVTIHTSKNKADSVKWNYNIKEKTITNTITIKEPYKPRNQFYMGGGLSATPNLKITGVEAGLLFKNKKDQIFGLSGGYNPADGTYLKAQSFWKIRLGK